MQDITSGSMRELFGKELEKVNQPELAKRFGFHPDSPVFHEGEILQIKGGFWRIQKIWNGRMKIKSISKAEAATQGATRD